MLLLYTLFISGCILGVFFNMSLAVFFTEPLKIVLGIFIPLAGIILIYSLIAAVFGWPSLFEIIKNMWGGIE